ncbi:MAG: pilin [Candidatus Paceibacterota bacterium]
MKISIDTRTVMKSSYLFLTSIICSLVFLVSPFSLLNAADFPAYNTNSAEDEYIDSVTGKEVKVYAQCVSCSTWNYDKCDMSVALSLPECPSGYYTEKYYADKDTGGTAPIISSIADTDLSCENLSEKHRGCGCSADIKDRDGNVFVDGAASMTAYVNTYTECVVSCAYRVCVEKDPCTKDTSPKCDTPGNCQTGPGECVDLGNNEEGCKYPLSNESCDADGDDCTFDSCIENDDGSAVCKAGADVCGGLIPCGRLVDNPTTTNIDETQECGICSLVYLSSNVVNFLMGIIVLITLLALVIGGFLYIKTSGDTGLILAAKQNFATILKGFIIIFMAWVIVNMLMIIFGFTDPFGDGNWAKFDCNF